MSTLHATAANLELEDAAARALLPLSGRLNLQASYATVSGLAPDQRAVLLLLPFGSLALIAYATWLSWSCWAMLRADAAPAGARLRGSQLFPGGCGSHMDAVFFLLVLTGYAPRYLLSPCE